MMIDRRAFLHTASAALSAIAVLPLSARGAMAQLAGADDGVDPAARAEVERLLAGRVPQEDGIVLDLPDVAQNGASVPLTVRVDSAMAGEDRVTAIHIVATRNPSPGIARFNLSAAAGRAEVSTRIRLAQEQIVVALADMADGSVRQASARVTVTVGGCAT